MHHAFAAQLKTIISEYEAAVSQSRHSDASDVITVSQVAATKTRCTAAIERASGSNSTYYKNVMDASKGGGHEWDRLARVIGVAKALLYDVENNHLQSFEELLHGEVFGDFPRNGLTSLGEQLQERGRGLNRWYVGGPSKEALR